MLFMNLLKVIILGIIEGFTEWLPISSTGHLILVNEFIHLDVSTDFLNMFNVVIQLGAILAVVILYFHKLNPFSSKKSAQEKNDTWTLWFKVIVAVIPAGVIGVLADDYIEEHFQTFVVVAITLIVYGVWFILVEKKNRTRQPKITNLNELTYQMALMIGAFQVLSLIPGTSRSGATILGAIIIGASRFVATEFSFFLGIPVMVGASGLKILKFIKKGNVFTFDETIILLVGFTVAFIVAIITIKFLLTYLKKNDFTAFGWYRIILGALVLGYWLIAF